MNNTNIQNKIRGSLIGGAIGDALGYQIEFDVGIQEKQVTRFKGDLGIISDDTQMTLFTANALLWQRTNHAYHGMAMPKCEAVRHGYLDWLDTQTNSRHHDSISWIKEISELNCRRAPGNTCISALLGTLHDGKMGTIDNPINDSKGCGSVMRVAPCGLYTEDPAEAGMLAAECAAITHGHWSGIVASYVCAAMISMITYQDMNVEESLREAIELVQNNLDIKHDMTPFIEMIDNVVRLSKLDIRDIDAIRQLGEGWVADEAFAIAIYSCLKHPNSFEDAVVCAVNHDGDSDSTGAITGHIVGAALGMPSIPQYYVDNVELKDVVLEIADDLYAMATDIAVMKLDSWAKKYVDCEFSN